MIGLLSGDWHGFGPTFTAEKLEELYEIKVSREVVRKAMIRAGLWEPRKQRGKHRKRRERRLMLGQMIQLDGSPHDWFEGRAPWCTLIVFIKEGDKKTQWERACRTLEIDVIHAHSPQAKGRVERCNGTLQDRVKAK